MKKILALTVAGAMLFAFTGCWGNNNGGTTGGDMSSMGYKVGIGSYTTNEDSYGYANGKNGRGAVSTTYVTCVFDKDGVIVKAYIDEVQTKLYFDQTGQLADFTGGEVRSKRELGDEYNMRPASGIGKEWYEQIDALEEYLVGKDVNTITGGINSRMMGYANYGADYSNYGSTDYNNTGYQTNNDYANGGVGTMYGGNARTMTDPAPSGTMNGIDGTTDANSGANSDMTNSDGTTGNMTNSGGTTGTGDTNMGDGTSDWVGSDTATWMGDLTASVTIDVTNIQRAIQKAYANAK